jgi:hypothetical protein
MPSKIVVFPSATTKPPHHRITSSGGLIRQPHFVADLKKVRSEWNAKKTNHHPYLILAFPIEEQVIKEYNADKEKG